MDIKPEDPPRPHVAIDPPRDLPVPLQECKVAFVRAAAGLSKSIGFRSKLIEPGWNRMKSVGPLPVLFRTTAFHQPSQDISRGVAGVLEGRLCGTGLGLLLLSLLGRIEGVGLVDEFLGSLLAVFVFVFVSVCVFLLLAVVRVEEIVGGFHLVVVGFLLLHGLTLVLVIAGGWRGGWRFGVELPPSLKAVIVIVSPPYTAVG